MSLFRRRWFAVAFWSIVLVVLGLAGISFGLILFGIMHAGSTPICTLEGSSSACPFIRVKSSVVIPKVGLSSVMIQEQTIGLDNGETTDATEADTFTEDN